MKSETSTSNPALPAKPKKHTQPKPLTYDERHWELYKVAFQGLCAAVKLQVSLADGTVHRAFDDKQELALLRHIAFLAWNGAAFGSELFNDEEIEAFNSTVKVGKPEEAQ